MCCFLALPEQERHQFESFENQKLSKPSKDVELEDIENFNKFVLVLNSEWCIKIFRERIKFMKKALKKGVDILVVLPPLCQNGGLTHKGTCKIEAILNQMRGRSGFYLVVREEQQWKKRVKDFANGRHQYV
ncbi:MAG: hypothetical protein ABEI53_00980 [Candidatus Magasanikbacteria bacterium]